MLDPAPADVVLAADALTPLAAVPDQDPKASPPSELLDNVLTAAHVLAGLLRDLGTGRAWHPSGQADTAG